MRPVLLLLLLSSTALANREGFANARQKAERLERRGEWAEAAAWWEAAAETMEAVSAPLSALGVKEAKEDRDEGARLWWQKYGEEDARVAKEARESAKAAWEKAGGESPEARATLGDFMVDAIANYPRNYWRWGHVELRMESLRADGNEIGAWNLEARERSRWAARYREVCVAWWKKKGDAKRSAEFEAEAAEQEAKAEAARKRIAAEYEEGWDPEKLRLAVRTGSAEDARDAVSRLAFLKHRDGLREALEHGGREVNLRALRALAGMRDVKGIFLASKSADEQVRKTAAGVIDCRAPQSGPEWVIRCSGVGLSAKRASDLSRFCVDRILRFVREEDAPHNGSPLYLRHYGCLWSVPLKVQGSPGGLSAEFFAEPELEGKCVSQTIEDFDFDWGRDAPAEGIPENGWSFRASGFLYVEKETVAELLVQCDDAIRVRIDARAVIDQWAEAPEPLYRRAPIVLKPGAHSFVVEYADRGGLAALRMWLAPGRDEFAPLGPMLRRMPEKK
ncbi:MAG: hypothetical protein HYY18_11425 [Planctomycetes bacterium]|nr:hypothetical protein [Planctomycetota bacterium]